MKVLGAFIYKLCETFDVIIVVHRRDAPEGAMLEKIAKRAL